MSNEFVALIANIALTLSVIVAVIFGIAQVKNARRDRRERLSLETLRSFQTKEFAEMLHYIHRTKIPASFDMAKLAAGRPGTFCPPVAANGGDRYLLLGERLIEY